jgi:large subunit ribosomal protein L18
MSKTRSESLRRERRKLHIRKRVRGTAQRPRLTVFRSEKHVYAQIIDDDRGATLTSASTLGKGVDLPKGSNREAARQVGLLLGKKAKEAGIDKVVFDRNGYLYHGRVKALADGAREAGLQF